MTTPSSRKLTRSGGMMQPNYLQLGLSRASIQIFILAHSRPCQYGKFILLLKRKPFNGKGEMNMIVPTLQSGPRSRDKILFIFLFLIELSWTTDIFSVNCAFFPFRIPNYMRVVLTKLLEDKERINFFSDPLTVTYCQYIDMLCLLTRAAAAE